TSFHLADYSQAQRHLSRRDAVLKRVIKEYGPCTLRYDPDGFSVLCRSIVSQQISTKAAKAISARLLEALGQGGLKPATLAKASDQALRGAGLSAGKVKSLRDLTDKVQSGVVPLKKLGDVPDEEVIASLTQVHGIGPWTAEMFLIFSLGRPDV